MRRVSVLANHHGGPLHYLGNRSLDLPTQTGEMTVNHAWLTEHFTLLLNNMQTSKYKRCYEPFAGSASYSIAAMEMDLADVYIINDSNHVLIQTHRLFRDDKINIKKTYHSLLTDYKKTKNKKNFYFLDKVDLKLQNHLE